MSQTLYLRRKKDGTPERLLLECPYEENEIAKEAGLGTAVWQNASKRWSYPLDPAIVRRLLRYFPNLHITDEVWDYLQWLSDKQERVMLATQNQEPLCDQPLWGFQRASVRFLEAAQRCIIGHQMGTGKTPIACTAVDYLGVSKILVVCPNSVKWHWVDQMREWGRREHVWVMESKSQAVDNRAQIISGQSLKRDTELAKLLTHTYVMVLIINYDQLRIHVDTLKAFDFDVIIADEAHRLNNRKSQRSQAMAEVAKHTQYLWLLTGTPVRNNYADLYNLLALCDPDRFSSYWNFVNLHLQSIPNFHGGVDVIGLRDETEFNAMLSTYMFRVAKQEAMPQMPPKVYKEICLPMTVKQEEIYRRMEQEFIMYVEKQVDTGESLEEILSVANTISQIIRLRQICLTPAIIGGARESAKLDLLPDLIEDIIADNRQFLIYTWFRAFVPFVEGVLKSMGVPYAKVLGGQSSYDRDRAVKALANGDVACVVGTISSMGEGTDGLQAATVEIFCDIDWVPAVNEQAEDRVHRGEITESPTIIRLYHPNTVEADIRAACRKKERIINETVGRVEVIRQMLLRGRR